jgi:hypothetical protein
MDAQDGLEGVCCCDVHPWKDVNKVLLDPVLSLAFQRRELSEVLTQGWWYRSCPRLWSPEE